MTVDLPPVQGAQPDVASGMRIATNTIVQGVGTIGSALIGLATFLVLTRGLGPDAYGDYAAATAYLFLPVVIADVGLTFGVLREITAEPSRTEAAMRAFLPLSVLVSLASVSMLVILGLILPFSGRTKEGIALGSIGAFLTLMTLSLAPVLQARLQMRWAVVAGLLGRLVTLGVVAVAFEAGFGFTAAIVATVGGIAVTFLVHLLVVGRQISLRPVFDPQHWRRLLRGSVAIGIANALGHINFRVDTVVMAIFRSPAEVGYYSAAYKFVELAHTTSGAVAISVFPALNRYEATRDPRYLSLAQRSLDILLALAAPVVIILALFSEEIIRLTAGPEFVAGADALTLLAAFIPFGFVVLLGWRMLATKNDDRGLIAISASALAVALALNLILIPPFGMRAAALVTVGVEVGVVVAMGMLLVRRHNIRLSIRYAWTIGLAAVPAVVTALVVPQPAIAAFAAVGLYCAGVLVAPGAVREAARHAAERLAAARRAGRA